MLEGLKDFFAAAAVVFKQEHSRRWYRQRLQKALVLGLILLIALAIVLGVGMWFGFSFLSTWIAIDWVSGLTGVAFVLVWLVLLYFTSGPITLLLMSTYLSQFGDWERARQATGISMPELEEEKLSVMTLAKSLVRAGTLAVVVLIAAIIGLIPFLVFLPIVVGAYAVAKDWIWMSEEVFAGRPKKQQGAFYVLGLGLVPAILGSLPLVGVATLPILQLACLRCYAISGDSSRS